MPSRWREDPLMLSSRVFTYPWITIKKGKRKNNIQRNKNNGNYRRSITKLINPWLILTISFVHNIKSCWTNKRFHRLIPISTLIPKRVYPSTATKLFYSICIMAMYLQQMQLSCKTSIVWRFSLSKQKFHFCRCSEWMKPHQVVFNQAVI